MNINEKYFLGGYNPDHPSQNVQYRVYDNEDGTGTYIEYDTDGSILVEEDVELDIPEPVSDPTTEILSILGALSPEEIARVLSELEGGVSNG